MQRIHRPTTRCRSTEGKQRVEVTPFTPDTNQLRPAVSCGWPLQRPPRLVMQFLRCMSPYGTQRQFAPRWLTVAFGAKRTFRPRSIRPGVHQPWRWNPLPDLEIKILWNVDK